VKANKMCYDCGSIPTTFFGCVAGNVTDYCYIFGQEASKEVYFLFILMIVCIFSGFFALFYYLYNKKKINQK